VLTAMAAATGTANGAETLGSVAFPGACPENTTYIGTGVSSGPDFLANNPGVVTSFAMNSPSGPAPTVVLEVFQPDPATSATNFIARQKDITRTLATPNAINFFTGLHLPIEAEETVGLFIPPGQASGNSCLGGTVSSADKYDAVAGDPSLNSSVAFAPPASNVRVNLAAIVEPDADHDTFGDETQDKCVGAAGPLDGCPAPTSTTSTTKKKCKKKKKHHSGIAAKKKHCRKHKKK
jgi:hypothetical protein